MSKIYELLGIGSLDAKFIDNLLDDCDKIGTYYPELSELDDIGITKIDANSLIFLIMDKILYQFMDEMSNYIKEKYPMGDYTELDDNGEKIYTNYGECFNYIVNDDWYSCNFINCIDSHYVVALGEKEFWIDSVLYSYVNDGIEEAFEELKNVLNY